MADSKKEGVPIKMPERRAKLPPKDDEEWGDGDCGECPTGEDCRRGCILTAAKVLGVGGRKSRRRTGKRRTGKRRKGKRRTGKRRTGKRRKGKRRTGKRRSKTRRKGRRQTRRRR